MLTDDQWAILEPILIEKRKCAGRPPIHSDREVLNGIIWVLGTGSPWLALPDNFPSSSTCFRRYSKWDKEGKIQKILEKLDSYISDNCMDSKASNGMNEAYVVAKQGPKIGYLKRDKGIELMIIANNSGCLSPWTRILLSLLKSDSSRQPEMRLIRLENSDDINKSMLKTPNVINFDNNYK